MINIMHNKWRGQTTNFITISGICSATVVITLAAVVIYIQIDYAILMGFLAGKKYFFHIVYSVVMAWMELLEHF